MRAEARVRRGVRGYGNAGPTRPRSIPSVRAFDEERHHDGPDGLGLAAGMSGEARHDLRSRNPGARYRVSLLQVAGEDFTLMDPAAYETVISR